MHIEPDHARAAAISQAWYRRAAAFDPKIADPITRQALAAQSWNESSFAKVTPALYQAQVDAHGEGLHWSYAWTLSPGAYDFAPEPLYQFIVLNALLGMAQDMPQVERRPELLNDITARQTDGWSLSALRGEPLASVNDGIGYVHVPFAWDDLCHLSIDGWLRWAGLEASASVEQLCAQGYGARARIADTHAALPYWHSLLIRALAAQLPVPAVAEAQWIKVLSQHHSLLHTDVLHMGVAPAGCAGSVLPYLAVTYTVVHELAHVIQERLNTDFTASGIHDARAGALRAELDADERGMAALWNNPRLLRAAVPHDQALEVLWFASGMVFYFTLTSYLNVRRAAAHCSAEDKGEALAQQLEGVKQRWQRWNSLASDLAHNAFRKGIPGAETAYRQVAELGTTLVLCSNALLDETVPLAARAWKEAQLLHGTFLRELGVSEGS